MSKQEVSDMLDTAHQLLQKGKRLEAQCLIDKITTTDPDNAAAWANLCKLNIMQGSYDQAESSCRIANALLPGSVEILTNLAKALLQASKFAEAVDIYQQLVKLQPESAVFHYSLGTIRSTLGQLDMASDAFNKTLALNPNHADSHYGLGFIAYTQRNYPEAADHFLQVLRFNPNNAQAHNGLASTLQALGQYREALAHYDAALKLVPVYVDAHFGRGSTLIALGDTEGAIQSLQEAIRLNPNHAGAYINLASALMTRGRHDDALGCCEKALQISPQHADAIALAATIEQHAGKAERALERLQPWIDHGIQNINLAVAFAEVSKTLDRPDVAIELMEQLLAQKQPLPVTSQRNLHFNLGRLYDKTEQYDKAFEHYHLGNKARLMEYDPEVNAREINALIGVHGPAFMAAAPRASIKSDKPVFVIGMPRSGTSLVEQILASHPKVHGAGELPDMWHLVKNLPAIMKTDQKFPECMTSLGHESADALCQEYLNHLDQLAPDAARVVDKMPGNFRFLGLIELLFPDARVIHCMRDPMDTCLSCYFQDFSQAHAYSYDLSQLGAYYNDYRRLMEHWRQVLQIPILDVHYEDLIENQEAVSRELVNFCGLDWNDDCLSFHETQRFVATASYDQVRRPLYSSSVARWKHYENHLGPLIQALAI